jgi:hypothetical protein
MEELLGEMSAKLRIVEQHHDALCDAAVKTLRKDPAGVRNG